jgi:uncharacterized protein YndB with AHSA1/START domain
MNSDVKITGNRLQITRVFDAPRERVFAAWRNPAVLQRWTGCKDATNVECQADFRVGGAFTTKMHIGGQANCDCAFTGTYDEIAEPSKIAYHVNLGPAVTRVVVEFFELAGKTRMVLTQDGFPDEMIIKFVTQGTLESFEKLDGVLTSHGASA